LNRTIIRRGVTFATGVALGLSLLAGTAYADPKGNGGGSSNNNSAGRSEVREEKQAAPKQEQPKQEQQPSSKSEPKQETKSGGGGSSMGTKDDCNETPDNGSGKGANDGGGYQSTCDPVDDGGNGQESGPGNHTGKPCAGCVGNADDKNPPGQAPDGSDSNSGYECDGRDRPTKNQKGNGNHGVGDENPAHTGCANQGTPPKCPNGSPVPPSGKCNGGDTKTCPDGTALPANGVNGCGGGGGGGGGGKVTPPLSTEVLGTTISNPARPATPAAAVLSDTRAVTDLPAPAAAAAKNDRVEVLGMTLSRGASSLARTGAGFGPLVMVAAALLAMGIALVRVRRRPTVG
jgi:hypothetical protein